MSVIVTVEGTPARRYQVVPEDEHLFDGVPSGKVPEAEGTPAAGGTTWPPSITDIRDARELHIGRFSFGCQQVVRGGLNEMYRTLSTWEIVRITRK